ncbi:MAG: hypothetical protein HC840_25725 [Leptolyngbyaceae cyanobacterium RM2_2_4]|nr:hypothetical protein [Leptolyngbyaceae cyanobacterium RM2_2_4]
MSFNETKTLSNQDSKVRIDVETLARIELSDIEFLLEQTRKGVNSTRLERILYETIINKLSCAFQLAMRAYEYLEKNQEKKQLIEKYEKTGNSSLGKIASYRADLFHNGIHFTEKEVFYPFARIKGRGFKAIHVKKNAKLEIQNCYIFHSSNSEFAITSEGVFEIINGGTSDEVWLFQDQFPVIIASNLDDVMDAIEKAIIDAKHIWCQLSGIVKAGDGTYEYSFLNDNGEWDLLENSNGELKTYQAKQKAIRVEGYLKINPPTKISIENNRLIFECDT